jgi:hypothetical protein
MKSYARVIPRDFFNEAKLLKCLGRLSLLILDNKKRISEYVVEEFDNEPFEIMQTEDGDIYVSNYSLFIKSTEIEIYLFTYLNSKENYPLYFVNEYRGDQQYVFDEEGNFTKEFLDYVKG